MKRTVQKHNGTILDEECSDVQFQSIVTANMDIAVEVLKCV